MNDVDIKWCKIQEQKIVIMSEDVVELQETQQEDRLNNHHASENKKDNNIRIDARYEILHHT